MTEIQKNRKQLRDALKQFVSDTKELLGSTADVTDDVVQTVRARLEATLQTVQEQVESGASVVEDTVEEQLHEIDNHVRANPYTAIGISLGVGGVLGFVFGRSRQ